MLKWNEWNFFYKTREKRYAYYFIIKWTFQLGKFPQLVARFEDYSRSGKKGIKWRFGLVNEVGWINRLSGRRFPDLWPTDCLDDSYLLDEVSENLSYY